MEDRSGIGRGSGYRSGIGWSGDRSGMGGSVRDRSGDRSGDLGVHCYPASCFLQCRTKVSHSDPNYPLVIKTTQ